MRTCYYHRQSALKAKVALILAFPCIYRPNKALDAKRPITPSSARNRRKYLQLKTSSMLDKARQTAYSSVRPMRPIVKTCSSASLLFSPRPLNAQALRRKVCCCDSDSAMSLKMLIAKLLFKAIPRGHHDIKTLRHRGKVR